MKKSILSLSILFLIVFVISNKAISQNQRTEPLVKKNSVYYEFFGNGLFFGSVNYDRFIPFNKKSGLILRGGFSWYEKVFPLGEINFVTGNQKHHFETGIGFTAFQEGNLVFLRTGYRFHGRKGFVFRVAPLYCPTESFIWFGISFGYRF